jgi:hypothetical protein
MEKTYHRSAKLLSIKLHVQILQPTASTKYRLRNRVTAAHWHTPPALLRDHTARVVCLGLLVEGLGHVAEILTAVHHLVQVLPTLQNAFDGLVLCVVRASVCVC